MWESFSQNAIWILSGSAAALTALLLGRERLAKIIKSLSRGDNKARENRFASPVFWTLTTLLLILIATSVTAVILSEEGPGSTINPEEVQVWLLDHGLSIALIIILSFLAYRVIALATPRLVERYLQLRTTCRHSKLWYKNRTQTLGTILTTTAGGVIAVIAFFMLLGEVGIDITPLLAGAGVLGVAIGFGAQSLIKDFLAGLFIFLEDHYNKGDVVEIAGKSGIVEDINLRRTVLRDLDGIVHIIPNGEITTSSNYTRDWARVKLDISVGYGEDLDKVFEVINRVGKELAADKVFGPKIKTAPQVLRVQKFGDSGIDIRILGEVKPIEQWDVTGELRKRLKKAFDQAGIEIPWPHVKLYFGNDPSSGKTCPACSKAITAAAQYCPNCGTGVSGSN